MPGEIRRSADKGCGNQGEQEGQAGSDSTPQGEVMERTGGHEGRGTGEIDGVVGIPTLFDIPGNVEIGVNDEKDGDEDGYGESGCRLREVGDQTGQAAQHFSLPHFTNILYS